MNIEVVGTWRHAISNKISIDKTFHFGIKEKKDIENGFFSLIFNVIKGLSSLWVRE